MDFLGIGLPELAVILILALIVVGPRRLPEAAAQIARTIREVRRYSSSMTRELNAVVKELEREYEEVKTDLKETGEEVRRGVEEVSGGLTGAASEAEGSLREVSESSPPADRPANVVSIEDAVAQRDEQSAEKG